MREKEREIRKESKRKERRERETQKLTTMEDGMITKQEMTSYSPYSPKFCFPKLTFIVTKIKILPITTPDL